MYPAYAAPSAFRPVYPNPPAYIWRPPNPSRTFWIVGGVVLVGAAIATTAIILARKDAQAVAPQQAPPELTEPAPTDGDLGTGFGNFPQGAAPAQAEIYYEAARSNIRRLMFLFLDQHAKAKQIKAGWQSPRHPTSGAQYDPTQQPKGIGGMAVPQPKPDKGPEFWTQPEVWDIATTVQEGAFEDLDAYPDIVAWAHVVSEDGPPEAWLKGIIAAELMRLTQAAPEPVDGQPVDWSIFIAP